MNRKNSKIEEFKSKLDKLRTQNAAERDRDKAEIERLTERLYEENKEAINKLRVAFEDITSADGSSKARAQGGQISGGNMEANIELVSKLQEADAMIEKKDRRNLQLEEKIIELQIAKEHLAEKLAQTEGTSDRLREKVRRLTMKLESKTMDTLVRKLKAQLIAKEKKMSGLRTAVVALKTEFVKAEQEREEERIRADRTRQGAADSEGTRYRDAIGRLRHQVDVLQKRIERTREDLGRAQDSEADLKSENSKLRRKLQEAVEDAEATEGDVARGVGDMRRYQRQVQDLQREVRQLKSKLKVAQSESRRVETMTSPRRGMPETAASTESKIPGAGRVLGGSRSSSNLVSPRAPRGRTADLLKRIKVLEAQNSALRGAVRNSLEETDRSPVTKTTLKGSKHEGWDAQKRMQKKIKTLQGLIKERTIELEATRGQVEQAKSLLERSNRERSVLQSRLERATGNRSGTMRGGASAEEKEERSSQLSKLESMQSLRDKLFDAENEIARLEKVIKVEKESELAKLRAKLDDFESQIRDRDDELVEVNRRYRSLRSTSTKAADSYRREDELSERLHDARVRVRTLQSDLVSREQTNVELRFETEHLENENARLRTRLADLEAYRSERSTYATPESSQRRKPGQRFSRERDLEGVVDAMKRVMSKLKSENERLKKSTASNVKYVELRKQVRDLKAKVEVLENSKRQLQDRADADADAAVQHSKTKRRLATIKSEIEDKDAELRTVRQRAAQLRKENAHLRDEIEQANDRIMAKSSRRASPAGPDPADDSRVAVLEESVARKEVLIKSLQQRLASKPGQDRQLDAMRSENSRLKEENAKLMSELGAFDLDFFEEIEDLKYKYQQAMRRNDALEEQLRQRT